MKLYLRFVIVMLISALASHHGFANSASPRYHIRSFLSLIPSYADNTVQVVVDSTGTPIFPLIIYYKRNDTLFRCVIYENIKQIDSVVIECFAQRIGLHTWIHHDASGGYWLMKSTNKLKSSSCYLDYNSSYYRGECEVEIWQIKRFDSFGKKEEYYLKIGPFSFYKTY